MWRILPRLKRPPNPLIDFGAARARATDPSALRRRTVQAMAQLLTAPERVDIRCESADQPAVRALLAALDDYLGSLYEPQDNHILSVSELGSPAIHFLVARQHGRVVGCAAFRRQPGEPATGEQPYGEIKRMMVEPAARGQGIGVALLQRLEQQLRDEGLGLALLETGAAQREAVGLYQRCGYRRRGAFAGYPDNGLSLFFEKALLA